MPKVTIENRSKAPQGVHDNGVLTYIAPDTEKTVTISAADYKGLKHAVAEKLIRMTMVDEAAEPQTFALDPMGNPLPAGVVIEDAAPQAAPSATDTARLSDDGVRVREGEADPAKANAVIADKVDGAGDQTQAKSVDDMSEDELRAFITERSDGQAPHPNCSLGTLRAKATVLVAG